MPVFWVVAACLTVAVTLAVISPILRRRAVPVASREAHDLEVYGAQLAELDGDIERGALRLDEAAGARAEIGRRLLKAASATTGADATPDRPRRMLRTAAVCLVGLGLPLGTLALYDRYGSPEMPDLPLEARLAVDPAKADLPTLVAQVEARLRGRPEDGAGWDMLAPIYLRSGRESDAVAAFANAVRILGDTPEREVGLGEALTQTASGEVTGEAKAAFERALALNPDYLPAKFFLALDLSQENRFAEARPAWQALIDASPQGAPWLEIAHQAVEDADRRIAGAAAAPAVPGPSEADVTAAGGMSGEDRKAMIETMVSQLASRLKSAPNDVEGWKRLIRSYRVLGDDARARLAANEANAAFAQGAPERAAIAEFVQGLGLAGGIVSGGTGTETTTQ